MDFVEKLATALADRYVIERELGAGGMARVFLACELRHDPELIGLPGAGHAEQRLELVAAGQSFRQLLNGLRLIARRAER